MLNCKQTARLLSKGLDTRLSLPVRMGLGLHLLWCRGCGRYRTALYNLHVICQHYSKMVSDLSFTSSADTLSRERADKIKTELRNLRQ